MSIIPLSALRLLSPTAFFFAKADKLAIWSFSPSVPAASEATQGALNRLKGRSDDWCFSQSKKM